MKKFIEERELGYYIYDMIMGVVYSKQYCGDVVDGWTEFFTSLFFLSKTSKTTGWPFTGNMKLVKPINV